MRLVLDFQLFQGPSASRGIGRYSLEHARELIGHAENDDVFILMNDSDEESVRFIRDEFKLLNSEKFIIIKLPEIFRSNPAAWIEAYLSGKNKVFEAVTEAAVSKLKPDFVLIYSYFEFIGCWNPLYKKSKIPTGIIIYDFIPYFSPDPFSPWLDKAYRDKIRLFPEAEFFFCISDFTARQAAGFIAPEKHGNICSIGSGKSSYWHKQDISDTDSSAFLKIYSGGRPFIFYAGGSDERKNLKMLLKAWKLLGDDFRKKYSLFIACGKNASSEEELKKYAVAEGIEESVFIEGHISDELLRKAYCLCSLFVFPSLAEGFGLTPLEAMSCGAPVIASDRDSLPYVIGLDKALFNPCDASSIASKIREGVAPSFNAELRQHALVQSERFSWESSAEKTIDSIRNFCFSHEKQTKELSEDDCISAVSDIIRNMGFNERFMRETAKCIADNFRLI